jgi:hypothetical protein
MELYELFSVLAAILASPLTFWETEELVLSVLLDSAQTRAGFLFFIFFPLIVCSGGVEHLLTF